MYNYRNTLYQNYYSTHSGTTDTSAQKVHFDQQVRYFVREFSDVIQAPTDATILDIGCGTGSLINALNELGYTNTRGVDLSEEQVAMAKTFGVEGVVEMDAKTFLADKQGEFDVIFAVDLIEHLGKDELVEFLNMVHAALKPGGQVIFRTPNMDTPFASVFAFADFTHEIFLNKSSATQVMQACGYRNVEVSEGIVFIENPMKEFFRFMGWGIMKICLKLTLFFTARTWDEVVFTPNIVITGRKLKA